MLSAKAASFSTTTLILFSVFFTLRSLLQNNQKNATTFRDMNLTVKLGPTALQLDFSWHRVGPELLHWSQTLGYIVSYQTFQLSESLCPLSVDVSLWPEDRSGQLQQYSVKTKITMEYVDYTFDHSINATVGPFFNHSLRQSTKLW